MASTPYENASKSVEALGPADQLRLVAELTSRLSGKLDRQPRRLLELEGALGAATRKAGRAAS
jgi:hypothetical protein